MKGSRTGGGDHNASACWQPHSPDDLPLLGVGYTRGVQPIGQLIGGPSGVMPNKCCGEVLWHPCALTLCDEPLTSAMEHGPVQLRAEASQVRIPLHNLVHCEVREQPAGLWKRGIQQPYHSWLRGLRLT